MLQENQNMSNVEESLNPSMSSVVEMKAEQQILGKAQGVVNGVGEVDDSQPVKKDARFWLIILSIMLASYIVALDLVSYLSLLHYAP